VRQFKRSDRVSEQMLRDISVIFETELRDDSPGLITFTRVKLTSDLRIATVYYSTLGDDERRERVAEFLQRNTKKVRGLVGRGLRMRHIPELSFTFDPSIEEGIKIEKLLNEIKSDSDSDDR
jgi:ribosome-binding factor A